MTQYFFTDESGDAGLEGQASSSSHFVIAMIQLPERVSLTPLVNLRKALNLSPKLSLSIIRPQTVKKTVSSKIY